MLSDQQLMLLEQMTYFYDGAENGKGVMGSVGSDYPPPNSDVKTIIEWLSEDDHLQKLEEYHPQQPAVDGTEWADVVRAISNDEDLMSLDIVNDPTAKDGVFVFVDPDEADRAYVCFAGTRDGDEWQDNTEGLYVSDTPAQDKALEYVESLDYEHISVAGHSKGGNKAMYITILDDRVDQCVAMDGQGFSQEFLDKYWAEITERGHYVTNYSLNNDFVNILLFNIPGSTQIYIDGNSTGALNHSNTRYYLQYQDENGHYHLVLDENGHPILCSEAAQSESMQYLHQFTIFIVDNAPLEDKIVMADVLGILASIAMKNEPFTEGDKVYTKDNLLEFVYDHMDQFSVVVAYFIKYVEIYGLTEEQIEDLLVQFGFGDIVDAVRQLVSDNALAMSLANAAGGLLKYLFGQITDGKRDWIVEAILYLLFGKYMEEHFGARLNEIWVKIEGAYSDISPDVAKISDSAGTVRAARVFDRRGSTLERITDTMNKIDGQAQGSVSKWSGYASEDWFDTLLVSTAVSGINLYAEYLQNVNESCRSQLSTIFQISWDIDSAKGAAVRGISERVQVVSNGLLAILSSLG